jgi:hypothetical protein
MMLINAVILTCALSASALGPLHDPPGDPAAPALVQFVNQTDSPILVYLDGAYQGWCAPAGKLSVGGSTAGERIVLGRFRCDRWGPAKIRLERGRLTRHVFTETDRVTRK